MRRKEFSIVSWKVLVKSEWERVEPEAIRSVKNLFDGKKNERVIICVYLKV